MFPTMVEEGAGDGVVVFVVVISRVSCAPLRFFVFVEEKMMGSRAQQFVGEIEFNSQIFSVTFQQENSLSNQLFLW